MVQYIVVVLHRSTNIAQSENPEVHARGGVGCLCLVQANIYISAFKVSLSYLFGRYLPDSSAIYKVSLITSSGFWHYTLSNYY
jgi:hypothetical protein